MNNVCVCVMYVYACMCVRLCAACVSFFKHNTLAGGETH